MFCNFTTMCAATSPGFIQWNSFMSLLLRMSCLKVCRTHTLYQNGSHHQKSNTSFYSICPYESTRGRYLQTDPLFHSWTWFLFSKSETVQTNLKKSEINQWLNSKDSIRRFFSNNTYQFENRETFRSSSDTCKNNNKKINSLQDR